MRQTVRILVLTLACLAGLDAGVAGLLQWAEARGRLGSVVTYFEYGRSVPGKLQRWTERPEVRGNLFDVAWRADGVAISAAGFADEPQDAGPVVRSYGMSFVNNVLEAAQQVDPGITLDFHAGPGAPPNFTYAMFHDDRANRRPGDVVVLGILSSSVPGMAALSNRSWVFEQPAPFTYPVYHPEGDSLRRVDPLIATAQAERDLARDPDAARAWERQMAQEDAFHSPVTFGARLLDHSPFARLVRRSLAKDHIQDIQHDILRGASYPHAAVLQRMIEGFADTARQDGQIPVVMLIQTRDPADADVLALAKPALDKSGVAYFATAEHFDPRQVSGFRPDGHYRPEIDQMFGRVFAALYAQIKPSHP